ncbi:MAG: glycosyltransferase [Desulfarculaceae bacterium]|jgi:glycosyltransferase involved in cell wall biosynthesis
MKIVFLIRSLERGGSERQLCLLARGLKQKGHEVVVATFYAGGPLEAELASTGVEVADLAKKGRWDLAGFARRLRRLLLQVKPQILYSFLDTPNLAAAWVGPKISGLKVVWGVRASDMEMADYDWFAGLTHRLLKLASRRAHLIIANSQAGARHFQAQGLAADKMTVIPNGIDTGRFRPDPEAGSRVRAKWGLSGDDFVVGLAARLDPMKDIPNFLRAASLLRPDFSHLRFVCVGGGPDDYLRELKALAAGLGLSAGLIWAGERGDMEAVINAFDLLVLSSAYGEGFPNVVGEAMACAKPCVVTEVGDAAWLVGEPRLAAPPRDAQALAQRCRDVVNLPDSQRRSLGQSLRQRIEKDFSLERNLERSQRALALLVE